MSSSEKTREKWGRGIDPQLTLKATPPRFSAELLTRERLALDSPELRGKSVIAVEAPSGFGKTSLLAQWRREVLRKGSIAAWLNIDGHDDGPRLLQGLAVSMRLASGRDETFAAYLYASADVQDELEGLTSWLADVAGLAVETVLMLDDCHELQEATLHGAVNYLLQNAPPNLTVIFASRRPVEVSLLDALAQGRFARIDMEALRFSQHESFEVLRSRFGSRVDADSCMRLHERTEGWPLGLQLAIATIERSADLDSAISGLSSQSGNIQRFFEIYLVEGLDPELAEFLGEVAFVDALHPDFCTAITGRKDSRRLLSRLSEETPIFQQVAGSDWFRMHPLAREFLRARFESLPEADKRLAHAKAAQWFESQHMFEPAARQAFHAGEKERAFELVAKEMYEIAITGQVSRILEWIERLPPDEIQKRPRLMLAVGWTLAQSERHDEAARLLQPLLDDPGTDPTVRRECAEILTTAAVFMDNLDQARKVMDPWIRQDANATAVQRIVAMNIQSVLDLYQGAPDKARYAFEQLPENVYSEAGTYATGWTEWIIGFSYLWEGKAALAEKSLRPALDRAEHKTGRRGPVSGMLSAMLAAALWDLGRPDEAATLLANRLDLLVRRTPPEIISTGYVTAARLATAEGLDSRAWDLLEYLCAIGESRNIPRLCIASLGEQIRMHALRSHRELCRDLLQRLDALIERKDSNLQGLVAPLVTIQVQFARAYAAAAEEDWLEVQRALETAGPMALELRRGRDDIQLKLLRALAQNRLGKDGSSLLREATGLANSLGLKRILADTHPDLADWLRRLSGPVAEMAHVTAHSVPETDPISPSPPTAARVNPSALLTPKEQEVLQLLAGNMSNKQIALAMSISNETVKWHMKNLFGKLQAGTRKHLLDRARMLGILDFTN